MQNELCKPILVFICLLFLSTASLGLAAPAAPTPPNGYDYTWVDDFSTTNLHPMWSWVNEDNSHWSLSAAPDSLRIVTQAGGVHGSTSGNKNVLVSEGPVGDSQIVTKVTINPTTNFQYAGIHYFVDEDNYVQLNIAYANALVFDLDIEIGGVVTGDQISAPPYSTYYLKLTRVGSTYYGYYSSNALDWYLVGSGTADLGTPKVGLAAANNVTGVPEIPADFNFFLLSGHFSKFYQTTMEDFDSATLGPSWSWVNENPADWSLSAHPGYMRILTDNDSPCVQNCLNQPAPRGDFTVKTRLIYNPSANYQFAGIILGVDPNNGIKLGRAYCSVAPPYCTGGSGIYFDLTQDGEYVENFATVVAENADAYLYLERTGEVFSGYYSGDGTAWQLIGRHNTGSAFQPATIGLTAAQDFSDSHLPADFNYFYWSSNLGIYLPAIMR